MTTTKFCEAILATLKKEYGNKFDSMSQKEKIGLIIIVADQITKEEPEIMRALSHTVYTELNA